MAEVLKKNRKLNPKRGKTCHTVHRKPTDTISLFGSNGNVVQKQTKYKKTQTFFCIAIIIYIYINIF